MAHRRKVPMRPRKCPTGKISHSSAKAARAAIAGLVRDGAHEPWRGAIVIYPCKRCRGLHVGHLPRAKGVG